MEALQAVSRDRLRLYPDPTASVLVNAIAARYEVEPECVFVGVGSDDVLAMAFMTFFQSAKPVFFPDITYSFYPVWADLFRVPYKKIPLAEDFSIRPQDYYPANGGVIFPNPNAPTSRYESLEVLEDILQHNQDVVVIIDEAYIDFAGPSALPLLKKYENLLIVQTFSKSRSMAGMRIGYAIGSPGLIKAMSDVKYSFNSYTMSQACLAMGTAAVEDEEYFQEMIRRIRRTRDMSGQRFKELGFSFPEPGANFIFVKHERSKARDLFALLRENNIFVRYFDQPRIDDYLRVTIGTDQQMDALFAFLKKHL